MSCPGMLEILSEASISAAICRRQEMLEPARLTQMVEHGKREGSRRVGISELTNMGADAQKQADVVRR